MLLDEIERTIAKLPRRLLPPIIKEEFTFLLSLVPINSFLLPFIRTDRPDPL